MHRSTSGEDRYNTGHRSIIKGTNDRCGNSLAGLEKFQGIHNREHLYKDRNGSQQQRLALVQKDSSPKIIGITGTIGSGKSLVGTILQELDIPVIDTDQVTHYLLSEDTPTRKAVIERFGQEIQLDDGKINRRSLAAIVFADPSARRDLEDIAHPAIREECYTRIKKLSGKPVVAVLVPLLFEAGLGQEYDETWTVITDESILRERLRARDNMTDEQIDKRLRAQWTQEKKAQLASRVIDNSGTEEATRQRVKQLLDAHLAAPKNR
jgi:dephospho-CoA kinase